VRPSSLHALRSPGRALLAASATRAGSLAANAALAHLRRSLAGRGAEPLVCGPFLGEPGYETLYWIPFLKRVTEPLLAEGRDVVVISRGGAEPLYGDLLGRGARYIDVLDVFDATAFMTLERNRLRDPLQKNQKRPSDSEREVLAEAGFARARPLLPSHMFSILGRYPYASVCSWARWSHPPPDAERDDVTLLKFWFGGQLPQTDENVDRLRTLIDAVASKGRVAAIVNPYSLEVNPEVDERFERLVESLGIPTVSPVSVRTNLGDQVAMLARSGRLLATYGGLAYLSLYTNTPVTTYYSDPRIVFTPHFSNFATAVSSRNREDPGRPLSVSLVDLHAG
jgi:hypothetical protein